MKQMAEDKGKDTHYTSVHTPVKRKYSGISVFPPYATEEQKAQVLRTGKPLQAKLKVSTPGDKGEQEADEMADKVMNMPDPRIQRKDAPGKNFVHRQNDPENDQPEKEVDEEPEVDEVGAKLTDGDHLQRDEEDENPGVEETSDVENEKTEASAKHDDTVTIQRQENSNDPKGIEDPEQVPTEEKDTEGELKEKEINRQQETGDTDAQEFNEQDTPEQGEKDRIDEKEANTAIKMERNPGKAPVVTRETEAGIHALKGRGKPLSREERAFFEPRFGYDFRNVRIHSDSNASGLTKGMNAKAFAYGKDIVFGAGQYQPGTYAGKRLMAHELSHVIQQGKIVKNKKILSNSPNKKIQFYISPLDVIDYVSLGYGLGEIIYLSFFYKKKDKEFKLIVSSLALAIDIVCAAIPGFGGAGAFVRIGKGSFKLIWNKIPKKFKIKIIRKTAEITQKSTKEIFIVIRRLLGASKNNIKITRVPLDQISILKSIWEDCARAALSQYPHLRGRNLYNSVKKRFWRKVYDNKEARKLVHSNGYKFLKKGNAPVLMDCFDPHNSLSKQSKILTFHHGTRIVDGGAPVAADNLVLDIWMGHQLRHKAGQYR